MIGLVLYLRPTLDPLLLIVSVFGFLTSIFGGIAAFMKAQETHVIVDGQLSAWKMEHAETNQAEGRLKGIASEQERVAEQKRVAALVPVVPVVVPTVLVASATNGDAKGKP